MCICSYDTLANPGLTVHSLLIFRSEFEFVRMRFHSVQTRNYDCHVILDRCNVDSYYTKLSNIFLEQESARSTYGSDVLIRKYPVLLKAFFNYI